MAWRVFGGDWQKLSPLQPAISGIGGAQFFQQVWRYVANIKWELFAKRGNLGP